MIETAHDDSGEGPREDATPALEARLSAALKAVPLTADAVERWNQAIRDRASALDGRDTVPSRAGRLRTGGFVSRHRSKGAGRWHSRIAAAIVVLCVMIGGGVLERLVRAPAHERVYRTHAGQHAVMKLSDGTTVQLAPQTVLTVITGFGNTGRTVSLRGEAYFDVATSARAPFVVQSGSVMTRVLGTVFSVRQYDPREPVQIVVQSGRVLAAGRQTALTISAGEAAIITDSSATAIDARDRGHFTDWGRGRLVFEKTPVPELLSVVGRWYGYRFQLADSTLNGDRVSVVLKTADVADMITSLQAVLDASMVIRDSVITIVPRRSVHWPPVRRPELTLPTMEMGK